VSNACEHGFYVLPLDDANGLRDAATFNQLPNERLECGDRDATTAADRHAGQRSSIHEFVSLGSAHPEPFRGFFHSEQAARRNWAYRFTRTSRCLSLRFGTIAGSNTR
jgi:hypothetical protein